MHYTCSGLPLTNSGYPFGTFVPFSWFSWFCFLGISILLVLKGVVLLFVLYVLLDGITGLLHLISDFLLSIVVYLVISFLINVPITFRSVCTVVIPFWFRCCNFPQDVLWMEFSIKLFIYFLGYGMFTKHFEQSIFLKNFIGKARFGA